MKDKTNKINQWNKESAKNSTPQSQLFSDYTHLIPTYEHHYESFPYEFNTIVTMNGEVIDKQSFHVESGTHKVIYKGDTTIVIFDDGSRGVSKRDPSDTYDKFTGYYIAFNRAKIKKLQKELKKLTK